MRRYASLLSILILFSMPVMAQDNRGKLPVYEVGRISGDEVMPPDALSREIASFTSDAALLSFLNKKFSQPKAVKLLIVKRKKDGTKTYITYSFHTKLKAISTVAVMASKNVPLNEVHKPEDFIEIFPERLVIIDSLRFKVFLPNSGFSPDKFNLIFANEKAAIDSIRLHRRGDWIACRKNEFKTRGEAFGKYSLRNFEDMQQNLAVTNIRFLTSSEKEDFKNFVKTFKDNSPSASNLETMVFAQGLADVFFGPVNPVNLKEFLVANQFIHDP